MENSRHTFFIVASYGVFALALLIELIALARRRAAALRRIEHEDPEDDL